MPGCVVKCELPYVEYAAALALGSMGFRVGELPEFTCCMYPIQFGTMTDEDRKSHILKMGETTGKRPLVDLCAGCDEAMKMAGVRSEHLIGFLYEHMNRLPKLGKPLRVAVEPGCTAHNYSDKMKDVVRAMGCEPTDYRPGCCGKGNRNVGAALMAERQEEVGDADLIVVGCPMC